MAKPKDVVGHDHFFPAGDHDMPDDTRVDACKLADGRFVVWVLADDSETYCVTWRAACVLARLMCEANAALARDVHAYLVEHGPTHANVVLETFQDRWASGSASLGDMVIAYGRVGYGAGRHLVA